MARDASASRLACLSRKVLHGGRSYSDLSSLTLPSDPSTILFLLSASVAPSTSYIGKCPCVLGGDENDLRARRITPLQVTQKDQSDPLRHSHHHHRRLLFLLCLLNHARSIRWTETSTTYLALSRLLLRTTPSTMACSRPASMDRHSSLHSSTDHFRLARTAKRLSPYSDTAFASLCASTRHYSRPSLVSVQ